MCVRACLRMCVGSCVYMRAQDHSVPPPGTVSDGEHGAQLVDLCIRPRQVEQARPRHYYGLLVNSQYST